MKETINDAKQNIKNITSDSQIKVSSSENKVVSETVKQNKKLN